MSAFSTLERQRFGNLLGMGSGYVLNFADRTFAELTFEFELKNEKNRPFQEN